MYFKQPGADRGGEREELRGESETDSQGGGLERGSKEREPCMHETRTVIRGRVVPDIQLR